MIPVGEEIFNYTCNMENTRPAKIYFVRTTTAGIEDLKRCLVDEESDVDIIYESVEKYLFYLFDG